MLTGSILQEQVGFCKCKACSPNILNFTTLTIWVNCSVNQIDIKMKNRLLASCGDDVSEPGRCINSRAAELIVTEGQGSKSRPSMPMDLCMTFCFSVSLIITTTESRCKWSLAPLHNSLNPNKSNSEAIFACADSITAGSAVASLGAPGMSAVVMQNSTQHSGDSVKNLVVTGSLEESTSEE